MISSQIKSSTLHTKVAQAPDGLKVTSLFSEVPQKLWSNHPTPLFISPNAGGCNVFYTGLSSQPEIQTDLADYSLSAYPVTFLSSCTELQTGCWQAVFDFTLSGGLSGTNTGECGCETYYTNPIVSSGDLTIEYGNLSTTLSSRCFSSFQEPLKCIRTGSEDNLLPILNSYDVLDCNGVGQFFGNSQSGAATILSSIFGSSIVNEVRERIGNLEKNISDIDLVDIEEISNWGEALGCGATDLFTYIPLDLLKPLKVGSTDYNDNFGELDAFDCYPNQVGELLNENDILSAGEKLFYQPLGQEDAEFKVTHVPYQNYLSSFDEGILSGNNTYPLSALDVDCLNISQNCFFRITEPDLERIGNTLNIDCLSGIPPTNEWCNIMQQNLEFNLLSRVF